MNLKKAATGGFTLIEVMVVMVIVAVLAAVSYPSYVEYIARGKRAQARAALVEAAQFMNRFYTVNDRYDQDLAGGAVEIPASLAQSPKSGTAEYRIQLLVGSVNRGQFAVQAVPVSPDRCGTFQINESGQKALVPTPAAEVIASCWK